MTFSHPPPVPAAPLPEHIQTAIRSLSWRTDGPPLHYQSLEGMQRIRAPPLDIPTSIRVLTEQATVPHKENVYLAQIATALVLLGHGCVDEAHDLVLSLSWRGDLPYAYGPPISVKDEDVQVYACYAHCLVHRAEGPHASEFQMDGYENSDFWAGHAMRDDPSRTLPLAKIRQAVQALPNIPPGFLEQAMQGIFEAWDPRVLTQVLRRCSSGSHGGDTATPSTTTTTTTAPVPTNAPTSQEQSQSAALLRQFSQDAALVELKVVLQGILEKMGYRVPMD
jgi:hypothetical protein